MRRATLFALATTFIAVRSPMRLREGAPERLPSERLPSERLPSKRPSFKAPAPFIGPASVRQHPRNWPPRQARRYIPPGSASANPYDTPAVGRASPAAVFYASTAQYRSSAVSPIARRAQVARADTQTTVSKSRGAVQCHGPSGTIHSWRECYETYKKGHTPRVRRWSLDRRVYNSIGFCISTTAGSRRCRIGLRSRWRMNACHREDSRNHEATNVNVDAYANAFGDFVETNV